jgi:ATP-dependent Lon protease
MVYENDPDYVPSESYSNSESEELDESEEYKSDHNEYSDDNDSEIDYESNNNNNNNNIMLLINSGNKLGPLLSNIMKRKRYSIKKPAYKKNKYDEITTKYNDYERDNFDNMSDYEKEEIYQLEKNLEKTGYNIIEPLRFKFLRLNISNTVKNIIISKLEQLNNMTPCSGEYFKLSNWINTLSKIPLGKYHTLPITNTDNDIAPYLQNIKNTIDKNIFGHNETKEQIIRILAQWISNPNSNGYVIGIQGSPGVGKTKLIKEGICKAMEYPFSFISLGGISDASYLNGHHYTYEGATYGKIIECLIKARVMNPVFLFDELDKVSNTTRGDEIINTLIHITDPVQNDKYTDKYFEEIDLDLSKSLIIFTYNDENAINPILKDRMITIKVSGYNSKEKLTLCKDYIIPELLPQYNIKKEDLIFEEQLLKNIIEQHGQEEGVRNLKRILNDIISWINMLKYIPIDDIKITFPFIVNCDFYNKYCKKVEKKVDTYRLSMYI